MVKQVINVGANANDGTGDDLRTAMQKINTNFSELYGTTAEANDLVEDITPQLGGNLDLQNFIITTGLTNGNISLQPNGTGSVLLKNIRITDNVISSDDSTSITVNESLVVTGSANFASTLSAPTVVTNVIRSDDSSIIEVNNGLQVAGSVKSTGVVTNSLSSEDSTAIQVGDSLNVNGDVTASTVDSNTFNTTELNISNNQILAYNSNSDIILTPNGTGTVLVPAGYKNLAGFTSNSLATKEYVDSVASAVAGVKFTGDDSTGVSTGSGDELQIKGAAGITTAVSGVSPFVLTITGPDLSSYATTTYVTTYVDDKVSANNTLTIADDTSSTSSINLDNTLQVLGGNNITTSISGGILTISGDKSIDVNEISSGDSSAIQINDSINISGDATVSGTINGSLAFSNLTGKPTTLSGYGITDAVSTSTTAITMVGDDSTGTALTIGETFKIAGASNITTAVSGDTLTITGPSLNNLFTVVGDDSTGTAFNAGETLKIAGGAGISAAVSGDTITISATGGGGGSSIGDLVIEGQTITTGPTNADLTISPNGVGNINLDADRIRVGDLDSDVTISSNGSADLILKTDVDNPSSAGMASITIGDGVDGVTTLRTSDNGYVSVGNTTWPTLSAVGSRNEHGLAVTMDINRNLSDVNLERYHASSIGIRFNLQGSDQGNQDTSPYRAQQIELITNLLSKSLNTIGTVTFDSASKNIGIGSGGEARSYAAGPVVLGIQNVFRNNTVADTTVEETACISSFGGFQHTSTQRIITVNNLHGIQQSFDLGSAGGQTVADNIRSFVATGNYLTNGNGSANNYYAFYASGLTEATNNYGIYVESEDWENYLGGLTIQNSTIDAAFTNSNLTLRASGTGKVIIDDTLSVGTVELNNISSADSSAIQINDSVSVSGTLSVDTIDTNVISSGDSSAIQINDDLNISGSLTVANIVNNTMSTNEISSADSSAIQINDAVNISGTLTTKTIVTNDLISEDSTAIRVLDGLSISGALEVTQISSSDSSAVAINDNLNVSGTLSVDTIDTNTISSSDNSTIQINDSVQISDNLTMANGVLTLNNSSTSPNQFVSLSPTTGSIVFCTDETVSGPQPVFYDGTNWRRISDLGVMNSTATGYFTSVIADDSGSISASANPSFSIAGGSGIKTNIASGTLEVEQTVKTETLSGISGTYTLTLGDNNYFKISINGNTTLNIPNNKAGVFYYRVENSTGATKNLTVQVNGVNRLATFTLEANGAYTLIGSGPMLSSSYAFTGYVLITETGDSVVTGQPIAH